MNKIIKHTRTIENGIEDIIERYLQLKNKINNETAYTKEEVINRLRDMQEADVLNWVLRILDIQDFELEEYNKIEIG